MAAVNELGAMARLAVANGGVMVTVGHIEREGIAVADKQSVQVLEGAHLWPLLKNPICLTTSKPAWSARRAAARFATA